MVNKELEKKQQQRTRIGIVAAKPNENGKKLTENGKKSSITLTEAKQKGREKKDNQQQSSDSDDLVKDIYQNVITTLEA